MEDLIRRAVGPDVRPEVTGGGGLWATLIDAPQLENALLNLCLDARDAMAPNVAGCRSVRVLTADDGLAGLRILEQEARIDLLLTDVGLPGGLNGREVAEEARARRPVLNVLFVTSYAGQAALGGRLAPGMEVVTKPFEVVALANKVGEMVRRPA